MRVSLERKVKAMEIYKVNLKIDTGYDWHHGVCVLYADNEEDAKTKADKYFNSRLHGENFAYVEMLMYEEEKQVVRKALKMYIDKIEDKMCGN